MNREQIKQAIEQLAKSQGFYCRLLEDIENDGSILDKLEEQHFNDVVDLILFLES